MFLAKPRRQQHKCAKLVAQVVLLLHLFCVTTIGWVIIESVEIVSPLLVISRVDLVLRSVPYYDHPLFTDGLSPTTNFTILKWTL